MDQRVYTACLRHAHRVLPGDPALAAEDLVQGAYLKTLGRLDPARSEHEQVAYLCHAVTQVAIDAGRRRRLATVNPEALPACPDPAPGPEDVALTRATEDEWAGRLAALDPRCGRAAALVFCAGLSGAEASAALGVPATTLRMRLFRARNTLRQVLS